MPSRDPGHFPTALQQVTPTTTAPAPDPTRRPPPQHPELHVGKPWSPATPGQSQRCQFHPPGTDGTWQPARTGCPPNLRPGTAPTTVAIGRAGGRAPGRRTPAAGRGCQGAAAPSGGRET